MQSNLKCISGAISHVVRFVSSGFDKELEKTWQEDRLTQNVLISHGGKKKNPNRQMPRAPVTFSGTMHTIYHFVNKLRMAASSLCDGCVPRLLLSFLHFLRLPSISVMSKRPYQRCRCRSRKCTLLIPISQDSAGSIRKHKLKQPPHPLPPFYRDYIQFSAAMVCLIMRHRSPFTETRRPLKNNSS